MGRKAKELDSAQIARIRTPGLHFVGGVEGLALQVTPRGARSWTLRAMMGGRRRDMGLGAFSAVTASQARDAARRARATIARGQDPIEEARLARKKARSLREDRAARDAYDASPSFVSSLDKGVQILMCFDRAHPTLTQAEAARLAGTTPASARRSLITLAAMGYLGTDAKRFWLMPKVLMFANAYLASRPTPTLVQPLLDALSERSRESASFTQLLGDQMIVVARSTARQSLTVSLRIGSRLPAYCSASGRVMLASLPSQQALQMVKSTNRVALTPSTVISLSRVMGHIEFCRSRGYAVCDGELEHKVRSMSVPVYSRAGVTVGALTIAVGAGRMSLDEMQDTFLPHLLKAQQKLRTQIVEG